MGKKGYQATRRLRERDHDKRGGNSANELPAGLPGSLAHESARYLQSLAVRNYTPDTIEGRRDALKVFLLWAQERDLTQPAVITKAILESYQRHLWRWRKKNGMPLGISTQRGRLGTLRDFFSWLTKTLPRRDPPATRARCQPARPVPHQLWRAIQPRRAQPHGLQMDQAGRHRPPRQLPFDSCHLRHPHARRRG